MEKKERKKTFCLSDESVNCYGYRVLIGGGDYEQFKKNPVMLYAHDGSTLPIGRWENLREEGGRLYADAAFDEEDATAMEIARKVAKGIIKCCSIGFDVLETDDREEMKLPGQEGCTVTKWRLMECSICPVGANMNAMALSAGGAGREPKAGSSVRMTNIMNIINNPKNRTSMTEEEINQMRAENERLRKENGEMSVERDALREQARLSHESDIEHELSAAVKEGRIEESDRETWKAMLNADLEHAKTALGKLPGRTSLSKVINGAAGGGAEYQNKTWAELDKSGQLTAYKAADLEGFKALYQRTFGLAYKS